MKHARRFVAVCAVLIGLLAMHGVGAVAMEHCLLDEHRAGMTSHATPAGAEPVYTPEAHPCMSIHDVASCIATAPRQMIAGFFNPLLVAVMATAGLLAIVTLALRRDLLRWQLPPPTPSLIALCVSRT
jgi:hypothetical protein